MPPRRRNSVAEMLERKQAEPCLKKIQVISVNSDSLEDDKTHTRDLTLTCQESTTRWQPQQVSKTPKQPKRKPIRKAARVSKTKDCFKFDFYYKRTCFRAMTLFFRTIFKPFKTKGKVNQSILNFVNATFPSVMPSLNAFEQREFAQLVKMVLYCHRYNKGEDYLKEVPLDFDLVRNPMYKYSRAAQDRFLGVPQFAFLFIFFAQNKSGDYSQRMETELRTLQKEA